MTESRPVAVLIDNSFGRRRSGGVTIIIRNQGLAYPRRAKEWRKYRRVPEFTAPAGKCEGLNKSIFVATFVEARRHGAGAGENQNDRPIRVHRVM